jgi:hypothetical protein
MSSPRPNLTGPNKRTAGYCFYDGRHEDRCLRTLRFLDSVHRQLFYLGFVSVFGVSFFHGDIEAAKQRAPCGSD